MVVEFGGYGLDRVPPVSGGHDAISLEERLRRMVDSKEAGETAL